MRQGGHRQRRAQQRRHDVHQLDRAPFGCPPGAQQAPAHPRGRHRVRVLGVHPRARVARVQPLPPQRLMRHVIYNDEEEAQAHMRSPPFFFQPHKRRPDQKKKSGLRGGAWRVVCVCKTNETTHAEHVEVAGVDDDVHRILLGVARRTHVCVEFSLRGQDRVDLKRHVVNA